MREAGSGVLPSHSRTVSSGSAADALSDILSSAMGTPRRPTSTPPPSPPRTRHYVIPFIVLLLIVFASATQTETASYLASVYGYDKPYFCFFVTHSTFALVFPIHFGLLLLFNRTRHGWRARAHQLLRDLRAVLADQLGTVPRWRALAYPLARKIVPLTALISIPAICWFIAMAFSPAMDITAIYATSAFFAYFFSLLLLGTRLTRLTLIAIGIAFAGVLVLTLAGAGKESGDGGDSKRAGTRRVIGDCIMVIGAILLGLYEVVYKMVLPDSEGGSAHAHNTHSYDYAAVPSAGDDLDVEVDETASMDVENNYVLGVGAGARTPLLPKSTGRPDSPTLAGTGSTSNSRPASRTHPPTPSTTIHTPARVAPHHVPKLPTALHSNLLTSLIGVATFVLLWPPFPLLNATGAEVFEAPHGAQMWLYMVVIAVGGAIYNAGLMILIGVWGPTTSSVANLLTIGLVALADAIWMGHMPDFQTLVGAAAIAIGFGILLWEGEED